MKTLTVRQQANRIRKWYNVATKAQVVAGLAWYSEAHSLAVQLSTQHRVSVIQAAQVIAVLSPQKKWDTNKKEARSIFNEHFYGFHPEFDYFATTRTIR